MRSFIAVICLLTFLCHECLATKLAYHHIGCYGDTRQERALPEYHGVKSCMECALIAYHKGYKEFGLQDGGECWTGSKYGRKYDMHGKKTNCKNGKGGSWSNDVYIIDGFKHPECPNGGLEGIVPKNPIKNCKTLKSDNPKVKSGIYWMNPTGEKGKAFQGYCDMETAGGGWTLVYSYTFTNYGGFRSGSNAITPQPDWPAVGNMPRSTEPPLSETHYAAMHYNLWKQIGSEFMIKSNINHWIACKEGSGSLLHWKTGSIHCQVVKNVAPKCHGYVPDQIKFVAAGSRGKDLGPDMIRTSSRSWLKEYYYLEASTQTGNWPTHDPCGTNGVNQAKAVANPHGNIYVR